MGACRECGSLASALGSCVLLLCRGTCPVDALKDGLQGKESIWDALVAVELVGSFDLMSGPVGECRLAGRKHSSGPHDLVDMVPGPIVSTQALLTG